MLRDLERHCRKRSMPPEIQRLEKTIGKWFDKICNYHLAKVSNGPTEALNNLVKRIKRIGFASETSRTTEYERCSMPASRTGDCSGRSWSDELHPARIRRAIDVAPHVLEWVEN